MACDWADECERGGMSLLEAMRGCGRPDWIVWLATTLDVRRGITCASACARAGQPAGADPRSIAALDLVDRWCAGEDVSVEALRDAAVEAEAARAAAYASRSTAAAAAWVADAAVAADAGERTMSKHMWRMRRVLGLSWIGWLNTLVLQWFWVRLQLTIERDGGSTTSSFQLLLPVAPLTGWWSDYWPSRRRELQLTSQPQRKP
jgi:hypothetical protein